MYGFTIYETMIPKFSENFFFFLAMARHIHKKWTYIDVVSQLISN